MLRGVRQRCVISPWLFNLFVDGVIRQLIERFSDVVKMCIDDVKWKLTFLFTDECAYCRKGKNGKRK